MQPTPHDLRLPAALLCLLLGGCATTQTSPSPADPLERVNRATFAFNDAVDRAVLKPVAKGYQRYVPRFMRTGVGNFLSNMAYPTTLANNVLQLKLMDAVQDTTRIVLNTTFGLGGLFDPASAAGLPRHDEDFGQTLGFWGVPAGPYLMLPLLGPSTMRDAPSLYVDYLTDARKWVADNDIGFAFAGLSIVNLRARLLPAEDAIDGAFDRYAVIRDAYLDRREYKVRDGNVEQLDLELEDWAAEAEAELDEPPSADPGPN